MRAILSIVAVLAFACVPLPPPKPLPSGDVYQDACNSMARFGDIEGAEPDCARQLQRIDEAGLVSVEAPCLAKAESKSQLDACYSDDVE